LVKVKEEARKFHCF